MKVAIVTDSHAGARGDSLTIMNFQKKFWSEVFYPYLDEHSIKTIIHPGDIVERRKFINFLTANHLRNDVIEPAMKRGIEFHITLGNHDVMFKNTNDINVMDQLFRNYEHAGKLLRWYKDPTEVNIGNLKVLMMPWITASNSERAFDMIKTSDASVMIGHLEIAGFEMHKGQPSDHGLSMDTFDRFDMVMSGHFHHRSRNRNIDYLGSPYETSWADYNDPKGFHVFDTETLELEFIPNPFCLFHKIFYDDAGKEMEEVLNLPDLNGTYVKVIVKNKENPYWFDLFLDAIEKSGAQDVKVIDDNLAKVFNNVSDLASEAEDTVTIIRSYISNLKAPPKIAIPAEKLMVELYDKAITME